MSGRFPPPPPPPPSIQFYPSMNLDPFRPPPPSPTQPFPPLNLDPFLPAPPPPRPPSTQFFSPLNLDPFRPAPPPPPVPPSSTQFQFFPRLNLESFAPAPPVHLGGSNLHTLNWFGGVGSSSSPYPNYSLEQRPRTLIPLVHPIYPNLFYPAPPPPVQNIPVPPRQLMYSPCSTPLPPGTTLPDSQRPHVVPAVQSIEPAGTSVNLEDVRRLGQKTALETPKKVVENTKVGPKGGESSCGVNTSHQKRAASVDHLKRPTKFVCKMKFRNDLPDPTNQRKLYNRSSNGSYRRFTKYKNTSLEKQHKPEIYIEPDLGIPFDLLDLSVFNPPKGACLCLDPEDEELLRDDDYETPLENDGFIKNKRPDGRDIPWLLRTTQYSSSLTMPMNTQKKLTEKRGRRIMQDEDNICKKKKIQDIEESFEACKIPPVHAINKNLHPVEFLPLLPDFDRDGDQFVVATFDDFPTCDMEKVENSVRETHESQAIMKSFQVTTSDKTKPDKFFMYMVPSVDELSKDMYDGHDDISFNCVRKYHYRDVRDKDRHRRYLLTFGEKEARYMPLPRTLVMRKKRATGETSSDKVEDLPAPSRVTVRRRARVSVAESKETITYSGARKNVSTFTYHHADNSLIEATVIDQDSGINNFAAAESNITTRPKRFRRKPTYLADYQC